MAKQTKPAKQPRKALGRGINALLGGESSSGQSGAGQSLQSASSPSAATTPDSGRDFLELDIERVLPNAAQPRTSFPEAELDELTQSIRTNGIVQPIIVREKKQSVPAKGSKLKPKATTRPQAKLAKLYEIVAGERRWRAAQRAELLTIPAIIREIDDNKMLEIALIENIQRQELNPIEESLAYKKLIDDLGLTQAEVAERVGKTRTFVANYLRLLNLPKAIIAFIRDGLLSVGHAKALLSIDNANLQKSLANEILTKGLSVRETERAAKKPQRSKKTNAKPEKADPNIRSAEVKLRRRYSTHVKIIPGRKHSTNGQHSGKIEFEYYGEEDLDRIYNMLMGSK
jgi:ParB family chromosome partitioning protein